MRVRGFTQDDAHIFCRPDQVEGRSWRSSDHHRHFGHVRIQDYDIKLSTRPEKYSGTLEGWAHAEGRSARPSRRWASPTIDPGEGVFYGPKIDLKIKDSSAANGSVPPSKSISNNPQRFNITYRDEKGGETQVFMIHRALLGSLERFLAC